MHYMIYALCVQTCSTLKCTGWMQATVNNPTQFSGRHLFFTPSSQTQDASELYQTALDKACVTPTATPQHTPHCLADAASAPSSSPRDAMWTIFAQCPWNLEIPLMEGHAHHLTLYLRTSNPLPLALGFPALDSDADVSRKVPLAQKSL